MLTHLVMTFLLTQGEPPPRNDDALLRREDRQEQTAEARTAEARTADDFFRDGRDLMAHGDYARAVDAFSEAQRLRPDFQDARRGEARALWKMSQDAGREGNYREQRRLADQAVQLDPQLADERPPPPPRRVLPMRYGQDKPSREGKWIGAQLTGATETLLGIGITGFFFSHAQLTVSLDTIKPAVDIEGKALFLKTNWTPYLGFGGHITLLKDIAAPDLWQRNFLHADLGAQYMHPIGFFLELGLTWIPPAFGYATSPFGNNNNYYAIPLPHIALGWAFGI